MTHHVDDLVLYTINTGNLYITHLGLAKYNTKGLERWITHVKQIAIPRYRREQNEPYFGLYLNEIEEVAKQLKDYYEERVKEGV